MSGEHEETIANILEELSELKKWINKNHTNSNVRYLVSYATVRACSVIETIFKQILFDYLSQDANDEAQHYLERMIIGSSANPATGQVGKFLQEINPAWNAAFKAQIASTHIAADVNALVDFRNDFAHGKRTLTHTIETVINYFKSGVSMLEILYNIVYNNT